MLRHVHDVAHHRALMNLSALVHSGSDVTAHPGARRCRNQCRVMRPSRRWSARTFAIHSDTRPLPAARIRRASVIPDRSCHACWPPSQRAACRSPLIWESLPVQLRARSSPRISVSACGAQHRLHPIEPAALQVSTLANADSAECPCQWWRPGPDGSIMLG